MKINVIGLGYIGLPTALMLSTHGVNVVGTDCNKKLVDKLNSGSIPFREAGLEDLFLLAKKNAIVFATEYEECEIYIICVPTPYDKITKKIDPSYLIEATKTVISKCPTGAIIAIESTVSPGTIDKFIRPLIKQNRLKTGKDIHLVHSPERIIPGNMLNELEKNNRTIGADDYDIGKTIAEVYSSFCKGHITVTDIRTAEMTKVVENTYRDINIAYANELQKICRADNMDVHEIIRIANKHPRVNILDPGPGVGGHCISVDPWFLVGDYPGLANIILSARKINDSMPEFVLERASYIMKKNNIKDPSKIGIYGLTYKADVDDVRESPTLQMLEFMSNHLCFGEIKVYDPLVKKNIVNNQVHSFIDFIEDLEFVIVMVAHSEILHNPTMFGQVIILDCCNIYGKDKNIYKL